MSDFAAQRAEDDFDRARVRETLARMQAFLNPGSRELLALDDVREILKPSGEVYRGMKAVPLSLIVGSEGRYRDFDRTFMPRANHLKPRWVRVDVAHLRDVVLPPIQLYEVGGAYFVRDGNHRVSVARLKGIEAIDAEVVSLASEVRLRPDMTLDELKREVVGWEKRNFYEKTRFGELTGDRSLDFTGPGQYDLVLEHILVHKYYINQGKSVEIPFDEALRSWYGEVYRPIARICDEARILARFPGRTTSDLYVYIVRHWDGLKRKFGLAYPVEAAARDYSKRYGRGFAERLLAFARSVLGLRRARSEKNDDAT